MHFRPVTLALAAVAALVATGALLATGPAQATPEEPPRAALEEARKAATELVTSVRGELVKAIEASGPLRAIAVCKYAVPEIASSVSRKFGARVMRVTLTPRNPALGGADAWEQKVLMGFDERVARGEKADGMEQYEVVNEPAGKFMRYARALPVQPVCMNCHGPAEQLSESIRNQLGHDYPHDRALGSAVGKVRGAVSYKKPL
ncbi:MAG: DUF3365 domain-containing protein [Rubrivivax sp.]|nr:DUF3365 domain-containing protein [Rubrivivax sp.]